MISDLLRKRKLPRRPSSFHATTVLPSCTRLRARASCEPIASPSGRTWLRMAIRSAPLSACAISENDAFISRRTLLGIAGWLFQASHDVQHAASTLDRAVKFEVKVRRIFQDHPFRKFSLERRSMFVQLAEDTHSLFLFADRADKNIAVPQIGGDIDFLHRH